MLASFFETSLLCIIGAISKVLEENNFIVSMSIHKAEWSELKGVPCFRILMRSIVRPCVRITSMGLLLCSVVMGGLPPKRGMKASLRLHVSIKSRMVSLIGFPN